MDQVQLHIKGPYTRNPTTYNSQTNRPLYSLVVQNQPTKNPTTSSVEASEETGHRVRIKVVSWTRTFSVSNRKKITGDFSPSPSFCQISETERDSDETIFSFQRFNFDPKNFNEPIASSADITNRLGSKRTNRKPHNHRREPEISTKDQRY
ncbi:Uncharacterized protein Rs2_20374 [Raphanus sativus]|nr:Uncharacterized protein Rs2_20374 [Raphanus sativus]